MTMPISPMSSTTGPRTAPPRAALRTGSARPSRGDRGRHVAGGSRRAGSRRSSGRRPRRSDCAFRSAGRPSCPRARPDARRSSPRPRPRGAGRSYGRTPGRAGSPSRSAGTGCSRRLRLRRAGTLWAAAAAAATAAIVASADVGVTNRGTPRPRRAGALAWHRPGRPARSTRARGSARRRVPGAASATRPAPRSRQPVAASATHRPRSSPQRAARWAMPARRKPGCPSLRLDSGVRVASWLGQLSISAASTLPLGGRRARPVARTRALGRAGARHIGSRRRRRCLLVRCRLVSSRRTTGSRPLRRPVRAGPAGRCPLVRLLRPV